MQLHLKIIGVLLIVLAGIHAFFPKYFSWKKEFSTVSLINRQMMQVHTLFIAIFVFLMGLLCISSYEELAHTPFGKRIALGLAIFWGIRLFIQFFGYSPQLWKGKTFETTMHIILSVLWAYLTIIFYMTSIG